MGSKSAPTDAPASDLFRTSVVVSREAMRKLQVVQAVEGKDRDQLIRELIDERVADIEVKAPA